MAKKKDAAVEADELTGTVEGLARDHWEREKAAYEERTGTKVEFVPPRPTTRTPIDPEPVEESTPVETAEPAADQAAAEQTQSEGDK